MRFPYERLFRWREVVWAARQVMLVAGLRRRTRRPKMLASRLVAHNLTHSVRVAPPALKVLVFSHNLNREGAPISLKELIVGLVQRGELTAEVLSYEEGPLRADYEAHGVPVKVLPPLMRKLTNLKRLDAETSCLASIMTAAGSQLVLANTLLNFPAILAAEQAGIPSVWIPRESEPWNRFFQFLPEPIAQRAVAAMSLPRKVVFVAHSTRKVWQEFESECAFAVIHNVLNPERLSRWVSSDKQSARRDLGWADEVVFLCTGTVCERKGQGDAIAALDSMSDRLKTPIRLVLVGDSSRRYARRLKRRCAGWSGLVKVDFVEATSEIGRYYRASDVFLLCSRLESYPRVILEALAFALPIVTTPVFGIAEQLPEPGDASFYEPGDIAALASLMLALATEPRAREALSLRSRSAGERMASFDDMCRAYAGILRTAVVG